MNNEIYLHSWLKIDYFKFCFSLTDLFFRNNEAKSYFNNFRKKNDNILFIVSS